MGRVAVTGGDAPGAFTDPARTRRWVLPALAAPDIAGALVPFLATGALLAAASGRMLNILSI